MRALAISGLDRAKLLPEIPTLTEVGVKMSEESSWYGFFAPKGTPKAIIDKINKDVQTVIDMPDMREREVAARLSLLRRLAGQARRVPQGRDREMGRARQEGRVQEQLIGG